MTSERKTLTLPKAGERKMSDEEWAINVDCDKAKRDHKWRWKLDITSGMPCMDQAVCVHCGTEATMTMGSLRIHAKPV